MAISDELYRELKRKAKAKGWAPERPDWDNELQTQHGDTTPVPQSQFPDMTGLPPMDDAVNRSYDPDKNPLDDAQPIPNYDPSQPPDEELLSSPTSPGSPQALAAAIARARPAAPAKPNPMADQVRQQFLDEAANPQPAPEDPNKGTLQYLDDQGWAASSPISVTDPQTPKIPRSYAPDRIVDQPAAKVAPEDTGAEEDAVGPVAYGAGKSSATAQTRGAASPAGATAKGIVGLSYIPPKYATVNNEPGLLDKARGWIDENIDAPLSGWLHNQFGGEGALAAAGVTGPHGAAAKTAEEDPQVRADYLAGARNLDAQRTSVKPAVGGRGVVPPKRGIGIGDRNMSLDGEARPGIGLDMTSDRHATLLDQPQAPNQETPQDTSGMPDADVDNKKLAASVNALSATSDTSDVAKAIQRPHAPENQSAYWAALKDIATAGKGSEAFAGMDLGGGYYDARMKQEAAKQAGYQTELKDWQQRTRDALKQKYESGEKEKDRAVTRARDAGTVAHYKALESNLTGDNARADRQLTETERHNRAMEARKPGKGLTINNGVDLRGHAPLKPAQEEAGVKEAEKHVMDPEVVSSYKEVMDRLNDPTPLEGMDAAAAAEQGFSYIPKLGPIIGEGVGNVIRGQEGNSLVQKLENVKDEIRKRVTGAAMTDKERTDFRKRLGINQGDSEFRIAIKREMEGEFTKYKQWFDAQHPQVQQRLLDAGQGPPEMPEANFGYNPKGKSNFDKMKGYLQDKFGGRESDPVKHAKRMQDDPEYRAKFRD